MFATYVHDFDPVIFSLTDQIKLRWYGLSYLAAFVVAVLLLNHLGKRKLWVLPGGAASDFIAAAAIFGVFIGGRLGYMFYYEPLAHGWGWVVEDPLRLFRVWDGGMASHGGILGLVVFTWFYARKKKVSWFGLGDGLCVVAPLGLMFGRLANFINGELFGRVADGVSWATKFPNALVDQDMPEAGRFEPAMRAATLAEERLVPVFTDWSENRLPGNVLFEQVKMAQRENPDVSAALEPFLLPRHPSQLYQAALEGALLFAILWVVRIRYPKLPHGVLTGLFFVFYAVFRILGEYFREPDARMIGFLTSGQFLSLFMIAGGAVFITLAIRRKAVSGIS